MRVCWLFAGQGAQMVGMGREFLEECPAFGETLEIAEQRQKKPFRKWMLEGPEELLRKTEVTQPVMYLFGVAVARCLKERGARADFLCGHSLGEYTALAVAGAAEWTELLPVVEARARFMEEAVPFGEGGMAALLGYAEEEWRALLERVRGEDVLEAVNWNHPRQLVVAGHMRAIRRLLEEARKERKPGRRVVPLRVGGPFHSSLLREAGERRRKVLEGVRWRAPRKTVLANVDARPYRTAEEIPDRLARQVASPVRWWDSLRAAYQEGARVFVEIAPKPVFARYLPDLGEVEVVTVSRPADLEAVPVTDDVSAG